MSLLDAPAGGGVINLGAGSGIFRSKSRAVVSI